MYYERFDPALPSSHENSVRYPYANLSIINFVSYDK